MASNFDFLKKNDEELFDIIEKAENLFRNEYFNQCIIQTRIFAEKMAKKILNSSTSNMTFDDILNCLKDKVQDVREKEFIEDLFFIKKQGNACAHGEDSTALIALDVIKHAFEASITYIFYKKKDKKIEKLTFDETLLITTKPKEENTLIEKYLKRAQTEIKELSKEEILNKKQGEFLSKVEKQEDEENALKDKYNIKNPKTYKAKKINPKKEKIKQQVKLAKKALKNNINKTPKKQEKKKNSKTKKQKKSSNNKLNLILFLTFVTISLILLIKIIFL